MSASATDRALRVVSEYLGSAEAQVRRNAATALATIGTAECAVHLANLAILDQDPRVRQRAISEVVGLDEASRKAAADRAARCLVEPAVAAETTDTAEPSRLAIRGHANDLLAALDRHGTRISLPTPDLPTSFALSEKVKAFLTPIWTLLWTFGLFWRVRRYLCRQLPPPSLWRPASVGFLGALPGGVLTAYLFWSWHRPLGEATFLSLCLPAALLTSFLVAVLSRTNVSPEHYCDHRMGSLVEALGFLWRPGVEPFRALAGPLTITAIGATALASLNLGFSELKLDLFHSLLWFLAAWLSLVLILVVMRATAITTPRLGRLGATLLGGLAGLATACVILRVSLHIWPHPGVAILNSETALLLLPFITGLVSERLFSSAVRTRGLSRFLIPALGAAFLVVLPGFWLQFNPLEPPRAERRRVFEQGWWLAHAPVWRTFGVDFEQRVQARLRPDASRFELRLIRGGEVIPPDVTLFDGEMWRLQPGDYELEVSVEDIVSERKPFSFLVRESYASAVGLLARHLLETSGKEPPKSLVGAYQLQLVLNAEPLVQE